MFKLCRNLLHLQKKVFPSLKPRNVLHLAHNSFYVIQCATDLLRVQPAWKCRSIQKTLWLHVCPRSFPIPVNKDHKFLDLIFDSKLAFDNHIKEFRMKCQKSLNILCVLSYRSWDQTGYVYLKFTIASQDCVWIMIA